MKIAPIPSPANIAPAADPQVSRVRSLKMNTNATPGRMDAPPEPPPADPNLTIPDTSEPAEGDEATKPLSPQLAAIARQRRALQVKEREIQDREKALTERESATQADSITKAQLKSDPLSVLLEAGVTYDQLTEAILANQNGSPEIQALKAELQAVKEGVDKTLSERDAQAERQVLAEMQRDAEGLIKEGEDFELVRETKSIPTVMDLIKRTYKDTGEVLDVKEALQLVEDELVQESLKLAALKKVQSRFAPQANAPAHAPQQRPGMRTLTNRDTAMPPMTAKQRALAAFNGTLKR